jgi:hypothetical protein
MGLFSTIKFLTEPASSQDFGKNREDWKASKKAAADAKKAAADAKKDGKK